MENEYAKLVQKSAEMNWCVQIYCTTCGSMEFRQSLREISNNDYSKLVKLLSDLNIQEYTQLRNWDECLRLAFHDLPFSFLRAEVLSNWLLIINENIRFADWNLFYFVRYLSKENNVRNEWISKCIVLAIKTQDESLIESLVWTLGSSVSEDKTLLELAKSKSASSTKIRNALFNVSTY